MEILYLGSIGVAFFGGDDRGSKCQEHTSVQLASVVCETQTKPTNPT
jgi:hypothetical protein